MSEGLLGSGRAGILSTTLNWKAFAIAGIVICLTIGAALLFRLHPRTPQGTKLSSGVGSPGYTLASLADSYAEVTIPSPIRLSAPTELSELEKLKAKMLADKVKRAEEARRSKLSFEGVSISSEVLPNITLGGTEGKETDKLSPRDDINRQDEKLAFIKNHDEEATHVSSILRPQASKYEILAGTLVPGLLLTGINSDLPGEILGQVSSNVFDTATGNYLLIPQGAKILGRYDSRIVYGQERVLIIWKRLIFPDGDSISLETMPGIDSQGSAGLADTVNNHYGKLFTGIVFTSLLGASAQMANGPNYQTVDPEFGQLALQGAARNLNETGQELTRRNLNIQPTIEIRPGSRFNIFVNKDVTLRDWGS